MQKRSPRFSVRLVGAESVDEEYDKIIALTGEMVVVWAQMDSTLANLLAQVADVPIETAEIIYYSPSAFSGRLEITQNLIRHLMPEMEEKRELLAVLERLNRYHKTRNSLIHSTPVRSYNISNKTGHVERREIRPATKNLKRSFKAQAHDISHHLDLVDAVSQYLSSIGVDSVFPPHRISARAWAAIVLNTA